MAELPEITKYAGQMNATLQGKTVQSLELLQEKCANVSESDFQRRITGAQIQKIEHKGKWIITKLSNGEHILLSLGMGADLLYFENEENLPEKYQVKLVFTDKTGYTVRFWWFGKYLLCADEERSEEKNTKDIAIDPFDERFSLAYFQALLSGKRTQIKSFLLNQKNIGGIGNMYLHDILFAAKVHPQRKISDLSAQEIEELYGSINMILRNSQEKGSFSYEKDFFGKKGGWDDFLIGYQENEPCPNCQSLIISIKTGSTSSFICPSCQTI